MKTALFYDVETTDKPLWREPSDDPRQPHIAQIAAVLVDLETRKHLQSFKFIVRPDGWEIPAEAVEVHGITTELALEFGIPEEVALGQLMLLMCEHPTNDCPLVFRERVAHSMSFDDRIIRIACKRHLDDEIADDFKAGPSFCTLKESRKLMNLPGNKLPTLAEAYRHFTGRELVGAHDAMVDTLACIEVYFAIQDQLALAA